MIKWHDNSTEFERVLEERKARLRLEAEYIADFAAYGVQKTPDAERDAYEIKRLTACQASHQKFIDLGRPTWLVSKEIFEAVRILSCDLGDDDLRAMYESWPYQSFAIVFEKDCVIGDRVELKSIWLSRRAMCASSAALLNHCIEHPGKDSTRDDTLSVYQGNSDIHPEFGEFAEFCREKCKTAIRNSQRLALTLLLLWRSRPHFCLPVTLPRGERFQFRNAEARRQMRQWKFPTELVSRISKSSMACGSTHVLRPHWRAGHFRHYRHEKFQRNANGSIRVEFIEPCFVGEEAKVTADVGA